MVQCGGSPCFTPKSLQRLIVFREFFRDELERNRTPQAGILGSIHDTHTATAQLTGNLVVRDYLTRFHRLFPVQYIRGRAPGRSTFLPASDARERSTVDPLIGLFAFSCKIRPTLKLLLLVWNSTEEPDTSR